MDVHLYIYIVGLMLAYAVTARLALAGQPFWVRLSGFSLFSSALAIVLTIAYQQQSVSPLFESGPGTGAEWAAAIMLGWFALSVVLGFMALVYATFFAAAPARTALGASGELRRRAV